MYDIFFDLSIGMCYYRVPENKVQETLGHLNKLNITVDHIEMAN